MDETKDDMNCCVSTSTVISFELAVVQRLYLCKIAQSNTIDIHVELPVHVYCVLL